MPTDYRRDRVGGSVQHLNKGVTELLAKAPPERGQGVVIRMTVTGDVPERQRIVGRPLDLAAGVDPGRVAVDQQGEQGRRVLGRATPSSVGAFQFRQVQPFHHIDDITRQMRLRQSFLHRWRQQVIDVSINRVKGHDELRITQQL